LTIAEELSTFNNTTAGRVLMFICSMTAQKQIS